MNPAGTAPRSRLAQISSLRVISSRSVAPYAGTNSTTGEIASALDVATLLDGDVQVLGDRIRVNVRLIDAVGDDALWANQYKAVLDDAFAIQSDIAAQIVSALINLTAGEESALASVPTDDPEAYQLYLRGKEYWDRPFGGSPGAEIKANWDAAVDLLERAVALDPGFALAHARSRSSTRQ